MSKRELFHLTLPTPFHEIVLAPTALLLLLHFIAGTPLWWAAIPAAIDGVVLALAMAGFYVTCRVLNARNRRRAARSAWSWLR